MAIRFDAAADRIVRTSSPLDYNGSYTWMGWFYITTDTNDYTTFFSFNRNDSTNLYSEDWLGTGSNGTLLQLYVAPDGSSPVSVDGSDLSVATWYHLAMVRESATSCRAYVNGVATLQHTQNIAGRSAVVRMESGGCYTANQQSLNGRTAYQKIWSAALTAAEIAAEMNTVRPQRFADLWLWTPLFGSGDLVDYSGNGRAWTAGGTLTTEDGPPVSWGAAPWVVPWVAASGTTYNQSAAGAMTPSGTNVRRTNKALAGTLATAGALVRAARKTLVGTLTPTGALIRRTAKTLTGALGLAGALASVRTQLVSIAGALTPTGALVRSTRKTLVGTLATTGTLARSTAKTLAGVLTPAGALVRRTAKTLAGALGLAGTIATEIGGGVLEQAVGGALDLAGTISRSTAKTLTGVLTPTGNIIRTIAKTLAGALGLAGAQVRSLFGPSASKLDVTLADAALTTLTLADAAQTTLTIGDVTV